MNSYKKIVEAIFKREGDPLFILTNEGLNELCCQWCSARYEETYSKEEFLHDTSCPYYCAGELARNEPDEITPEALEGLGFEKMEGVDSEHLGYSNGVTDVFFDKAHKLKMVSLWHEPVNVKTLTQLRTLLELLGNKTGKRGCYSFATNEGRWLVKHGQCHDLHS